MNEEMLLEVYKRLGLTDKVDFDTFKNDIHDNPQMQEEVYNQLGLSGTVDLKQFQADLAGQSQPTPEYEDKNTFPTDVLNTGEDEDELPTIGNKLSRYDLETIESNAQIEAGALMEADAMKRDEERKSRGFLAGFAAQEDRRQPTIDDRKTEEEYRVERRKANLIENYDLTADDLLPEEVYDILHPGQRQKAQEEASLVERVFSSRVGENGKINIQRFNDDAFTDLLPLSGIGLLDNIINLFGGRMTPEDILNAEEIPGFTKEELLDLKEYAAAGNVLRNEQRRKELEEYLGFVDNVSKKNIPEELDQHYEILKEVNQKVQEGTITEKEYNEALKSKEVLDSLDERTARHFTARENAKAIALEEFNAIDTRYPEYKIIDELNKSIQFQNDENAINRGWLGHGMLQIARGGAEIVPRLLTGIGESVNLAAVLAHNEAAKARLVREGHTNQVRGQFRDRSKDTRALREKTYKFQAEDGEIYEVGFDELNRPTRIYNEYGDVANIDDVKRDEILSEINRGNYHTKATTKLNGSAAFNAFVDTTSDLMGTFALAGGMGTVVKGTTGFANRMREFVPVIFQYSGKLAEEGIRAGLDPEQAAIYGLMHGFGEGLTESMFPFIGKLTGTASRDLVTAMRRLGVKEAKDLYKITGKDVLLTALKQSAGEGIEEGAAEILNPMVNAAFNAWHDTTLDTSLPKFSEIMEAVALGAAVSIIPGLVGNSVQKRNFSKDSFLNQSIFSLVAEGEKAAAIARSFNTPEYQALADDIMTAHSEIKDLLKDKTKSETYKQQKANEKFEEVRARRLAREAVGTPGEQQAVADADKFEKIFAAETEDPNPPNLSGGAQPFEDENEQPEALDLKTPAKTEDVEEGRAVELSRKNAITPQELAGSYVDYQGIRGTLINSDGLFYVVDDSGNKTFVESAANPDITNADIGLKWVRAPGRAVKPKEQPKLQVDFGNNTIKYQGKNYQFGKINQNDLGQDVSVTVRNEDGKEVTLRNPDTVARIVEEQIKFNNNFNNVTDEQISRAIEESQSITPQGRESDGGSTATEQGDVSQTLTGNTGGKSYPFKSTTVSNQRAQANEVEADLEALYDLMYDQILNHQEELKDSDDTFLLGLDNITALTNRKEIAKQFANLLLTKSRIAPSVRKLIGNDLINEGKALAQRRLELLQALTPTKMKETIRQENLAIAAQVKAEREEAEKQLRQKLAPVAEASAEAVEPKVRNDIEEVRAAIKGIPIDNVFEIHRSAEKRKGETEFEAEERKFGSSVGRIFEQAGDEIDEQYQARLDGDVYRIYDAEGNVVSGETEYKTERSALAAVLELTGGYTKVRNKLTRESLLDLYIRSIGLGINPKLTKTVDAIIRDYKSKAKEAKKKIELKEEPVVAQNEPETEVEVSKDEPELKSVSKWTADEAEVTKGLAPERADIARAFWKEDVKDALVSGEYSKAIHEGRMTEERAVEIIKSAGLPIPKNLRPKVGTVPVVTNTQLTELIKQEFGDLPFKPSTKHKTNEVSKAGLTVGDTHVSPKGTKYLVTGFSIDEVFVAAPSLQDPNIIQESALRIDGKSPVVQTLINSKQKQITDSIEEPAAETQTEPLPSTESTTTTASKPTMITNDQVRQLLDLGYSRVDVNQMTPEDAHQIINDQKTKPKVSPPPITPSPVRKLKEGESLKVGDKIKYDNQIYEVTEVGKGGMFNGKSLTLRGGKIAKAFTGDPEFEGLIEPTKEQLHKRGDIVFSSLPVSEIINIFKEAGIYNQLSNETVSMLDQMLQGKQSKNLIAKLNARLREELALLDAKPDVTEADVVRSSTLAELLKDYKTNESIPGQEILVQMLKALNVKVGFVPKSKFKINTNASYNPNINTIYLIEGEPVNMNTLIHEGIHALTLHYYHTNDYFKKNFDSLFEKLKARVSPDIASQYGFTTPEEFLTELFSDPGFAHFVGRMPMSKAYGKQYTGVSIIDELINMIMRVIKTGSFAQPSVAEFWAAYLKTNEQDLRYAIVNSFGLNALRPINNSNSVFITRDGDPIGFNYNTDKVARERFDLSKFKKIGEGSDRVVFDMGNDKVLKVAKTARGLEQNIWDADGLLTDDIIPPVFEAGLNYVVAENIPKAKFGNTVPIYDVETGARIGSTTFKEMLDELSDYNQWDHDNHKNQEVLIKYGFGDALNYDMLWADFLAKENWGYKNGRAYHIDGGTFAGRKLFFPPGWTAIDYINRKKNDLTDPEFREIYNRSRQLKKAYGDKDRFTRFSVRDFFDAYMPTQVQTQTLLAPNGKPSNLTPAQYAQVRTPEFIAWFGDWINDPKNASKVLDENGEPLVVYHGTSKEFEVFKTKSKLFKNKNLGSGAYFTANINEANTYGNKIKSVFLNVRNPIDGMKAYVRHTNIFDNISTKSVKKAGHDGIIPNNLQDNLKNKYNALSYIIVYEPNQIKSATDNVGTFDPKNPNIKHSIRDFFSFGPKKKAEIQPPPVPESTVGAGVPLFTKSSVLQAIRQLAEQAQIVETAEALYNKRGWTENFDKVGVTIADIQQVLDSLNPPVTEVGQDDQVSDQVAEPVTPPPIPEVEKKPKADKSAPGTNGERSDAAERMSFATKNEIMMKIRGNLLTKPGLRTKLGQSRTVEELIDEAIRYYITTDGEMGKERKLADDVLRKLIVPDAAQTIALGYTVMRLQEVQARQIEIWEDAVKNSSPDTEFHYQSLVKTESDLDFFTDAIVKAGTEQGRALGIRAKFLTFDAFTESGLLKKLEDIEKRAKVPKGTLLTEVNKNYVKETARSITKLKEKIKQLQDEKKTWSKDAKRSIAEGQVTTMRSREGRRGKSVADGKIKVSRTLAEARQQLENVLKGIIC